ncbi:MAG: hypothetical protein G5701_06405 [Serratia symbiotica]|nr:hypothetical protein [Serratia symbiotica]
MGASRGVFRNNRKQGENNITSTFHKREHVTNISVNLRQQIFEPVQVFS